MTYERIKSAIQIFLLFVLPVLLLICGFVSLRYRTVVLVGIAIAGFGIIVFERWPLEKIGIRVDNMKSGALWYGTLTVVAVAGILGLAILLHRHAQSISNKSHFLYGFLILSFLQEFLFRSFLMPKIRSLTASPYIVIPLNGFLFGFMHLIFPYAWIIFGLTALLGAGFAAIYYYRPNLILATASHSIVNFIGVMFCFASIGGNCT